MALYEGVSVIDHCSHCTGVDENLEDVVVTREQSAPGLHRSTSPVETLNPADTRSPCGHCFYEAKGIIYATAGICWYCKPGSNGSGSGGLNA